MIDAECRGKKRAKAGPAASDKAGEGKPLQGGELLNAPFLYGLTCGAAVAGATVWAVLRLVFQARSAAQGAALELTTQRARELNEQLREVQDVLSDTRAEAAALQEEARQKEIRLGEHLTSLSAMREEMATRFKALSQEALERSGSEILVQLSERAKSLIERARDDAKSQSESGQRALGQIGDAILKQLTEVDRSVHELNRTRSASDAEIREQLSGLARSSSEVRAEAHKLRGVLTNSRVRGSWGQAQLQNVVETAGMIQHCDFFLEESAEADGVRQRPDMRVRLPNGLNVLVDAKVPMAAYGAAAECDELKERKALLRQHALALRAHIREMGRRSYPSHPEFRPALPYTVIFLPNESLFFAALESDPEILAFAESQDVILTTPLSLIAFLKAAAAGWVQVKVNKNAEAIRDVAQALYDRIERIFGGLQEVGEGLSSAVEAFNATVGRQRGIQSSLKRLNELGIGAEADTPAVVAIESDLRRVAPFTAAPPPES